MGDHDQRLIFFGGKNRGSIGSRRQQLDARVGLGFAEQFPDFAGQQRVAADDADQRPIYRLSQAAAPDAVGLAGRRSRLRRMPPMRTTMPLIKYATVMASSTGCEKNQSE